MAEEFDPFEAFDEDNESGAPKNSMAALEDERQRKVGSNSC